jgi:hypothetical protein
LSRVITEFNQYSTAFNAFKERYDYWPGDLPNAFAYWGTQCAGNATDCDGDGNGSIYDYNYGNIDFRQELFMAWKHITLSGILPGNYTGYSNANNSSATCGVNIPTSSYSANACWSARFNTGIYAIAHSNAFVFGNSVDVPPYSVNEFGGLSPTDAYNIDAKIDDGMPNTGQVGAVMGWWQGGIICTVGNGSTATTPYDLTQTGITCSMAFLFTGGD